jgi:hypothetical protein
MSKGWSAKVSSGEGKHWRWSMIAYVLMVVALCWPAWLNGQAFFLQDTTAYIKGAASGVALVFKSSTAQEWLHPGHASSTATSAPHAADNQSDAHSQDYSSAPDKKGVLAGRSIYYGMYLFLITALSGLNLVPVITAIFTVITITTISRSVGLTRNQTLGLLALLVVVSPLPFFNSMLMPDIFAGLAILATAAFLFIPPLQKWYRYWWAFIILCAVLFHTANILILSGLLVITIALAFVVSFPSKTSLLRKAALLFGIVLIGIAGEVFFNAAVKHFTHNAPIRPPFITARLVADGPGTVYAKNFCDTHPFEICHYQAALGKASSDDFLWSLKPDIGVFTLASKSSRELLSHEDSAFALAVFKKYPVEVLHSTLLNFFSQLRLVGLEEFNYPALMISDFSEKIPEADFKQLQQSKAGKDIFPLAISEFLILSGIIISLFVYAFQARLQRPSSPLFCLTMLVLSGILLNALICGALSTPHDRYQARVIWLLPLLAFYLFSLRSSHTGKARLFQPQ